MMGMAQELQPAFASHLAAWRGRPYALGAVDCVSFVCEWVDATCETDYMARVRTRLDYADNIGVLSAIKTPGGYEALVRAFCGNPAHGDDAWTVGDVALFVNGSNEVALGLLGERVVYAPDRDGLTAVDCSRVLKFWKLSCLKQ
jgi:hypothetical protein